MNKEKIEQIIREYFPQIIHMSLATVKDNKPWVCEVHFSYDDDLNLYFSSRPETRHAQEILANPQVAGNIVTQHHKNQAVRCVDFEGRAEMLNSEEAEKTAYKAYAVRNGESEWLLNEIRKDGVVRFFKISVDDFYVFDSYEGQRTKNHLPWKSEGRA
jgi:uncharacterized protein YhbP (UPF0306 family)